MGEARRRGTFEQRKAAAIKRDAEILKKSKELKSAIVTEKQTITPEERIKRELCLSTLCGAFAGNKASMPFNKH